MGDRREKETDALYQAVTDRKTQVREPVYQQSAMSRNTNDIGYTYVEVDLPNHRLVVYRDGVPVVDTGILSSSARRKEYIKYRTCSRRPM